MKKYLLDTNIIIFFLKGKYDLGDKLADVGFHNCCISEITVAELKFGIENSPEKEVMRPIVEAAIENFSIMHVYDALGTYAVQKASLRRQGQLIGEFDILIGATAVHHNMIMVTNNTAHFSRFNGIVLEDWTKK